MEETTANPDSNGEILLFYVDENGGNEQGVVTTIQNIEEGHLEDPQETYIIEEVDDGTNETELTQHDYQANKERWVDGEIRRLLIFYIDNKETFLSGQTKKRHLWTVACKTMLTSKLPASCEMKIRNLKRKYSLIRVDELRKRGSEKSSWPYYDLCHQAFHDDSFVQILINDNLRKQEPKMMKVPASNTKRDGIVVIKKVNPRQTTDHKVEEMLKLYLKYKKQSPKQYGQKFIWEKIAIELGQEADYWHKRFLNYKSHYIKMLEKRNETGNQTVNWHYMKFFDEIYKGDDDLKLKQSPKNTAPSTPIQLTAKYDLRPLDWDETEKTVLVKYCFDCFDEFQDETIPNSFLWNEVERLLDKPAEICKSKYEELRTTHLNQYLTEGYSLQNRKPIAILFDNLITKEIELELYRASNRLDQVVTWQDELIDELVRFFLDSIELFKNPASHFVCWAAISMKLNRAVSCCREQWRDLSFIYKSILNDKKDDPEMQIDWRYTDLFDRIFDYGMDTKLLEGYEKEIDIKEKTGLRKIGVKKLKLANVLTELDSEEYDEHAKGTGDPIDFKILEYYQKNKSKFAKSQQKKFTQWGALAKQIGLTSEQCAQRFRNLKQVYTAYVQKEISKPETPILWPCYALCKKVFGYRAVQQKLKSGKVDLDEGKEWSHKEIRQLIDYFAKNFHVINNNIDDSYWATLSYEIGKSNSSCKAKLLELRNYYSKITSMKSRNPNCNVIWKYYKKFEAIYAGEKIEGCKQEQMEVDDNGVFEISSMDDERVSTEIVLPEGTIKGDLNDDEYQCIIVMPEGQDVPHFDTNIDAHILIKEPSQTAQNQTPETPEKIKWTRQSKKELLRCYLKYMKAHKNETIRTHHLWLEVAKKIPGKSPVQCKNMYFYLRRLHATNKNVKSPYAVLLDKILAIKPKFWLSPTYEEVSTKDPSTFKNIPLPEWKVEKALQYYLEHIEEFLNPKYEKKYAWLELAKHAAVKVAKIYVKIHYLKYFFNSETNEVNGVKVEFGELLKEIIEKEFVVKIAMELEPKPATIEDNPEIFSSWSEEEVEKLLNWYLQNLDKFKNPKHVPSYLWMEASLLLNKSPFECSKKMSEMRTLYSFMMKENPDALINWRYRGLCQKIYGKGKKGTPVTSGTV